MNTFRLSVALLVVALTPPFAFPQESAEVASLRAKAERGNGIAQYNLGLAYAEGRGTTTDPIEAFVWLSLARDNGARGRALDTLTAGLDSASLATARTRLAERRSSLGTRPAAVTAPRPVQPQPVSVSPTPTESAVRPPAPASPSLPVADPRESDNVTALLAERDALATRLNALAGDVATLRAERDQLLRAGAGQETSARTAADANRELQAARAELTEARDFARKVEDTLNRVNEEKIREARAAATELQTARAFGEQVEATLNRVNDEKVALETQLRDARASLAASQPAAAAYPDLRDRVAALEQELAAAQSFGRQVEGTLNQVTDQRATLEASLRAAEQARDAHAREFEAGKARLAELEARLAATSAAPAYPDLRNRVATLEQDLAALTADLAATNRAKIAADAQIASLTRAQAAAPAYPDLSGRVRELESRLADQARENETARLTLARELDTTKAALANANTTLAARPDVSGRIATLETELASAKNALAAESTAKANLAGRIASLESDLAAARSAAPAYPDLRSRVAELTAATTAAAGLSNRVAELENQLATARSELATASPAKSELEARIAALTAEAALRQRETTSLTEARAEAERSRDAIAKQFEEYKGSTAAALRERTTLQASVKLLESDKVSLRRQAETAGNEAASLRTQVSTLKDQLAAKPSAPAYPDLRDQVAGLETALAAARAAAPSYPDLSGRVTELETQLASARTAAPAYPDLSGQVTELESKLAAALQPKAPAYPDLSSRVAELTDEVAQLRTDRERMQQMLADAGRQLRDATASANRVKELETQLTQAQAALAARPAAPAYPDLSGRVATLEQELATVSTDRTRLQAELTAAPRAPAYPDLRGRVGELEQQLNRVSADLADATAAKAGLETQLARTAAAPAAPAYPDLSSRVSELETALADSARQLVAAESTQAALQRQLSEATAAAQPAADDTRLIRERDELSYRVSELAGELAQLRADRERMQKMLADAGRQMRDSTADANRVKELETRLAETAAGADTARAEVTRLTRAAQEAETNLQSLQAALLERSNTVTERAAQIARLEAELERRRVAAIPPAAPTYPDLRNQVAELEAALAAARNTAPAYPDLSGRVAELESQLARTSPVSAAPAYPDLSGRVAELEAQLARAADAPPAVADTSAIEARLAETQDKLTTALRAYALLQRERDAVQTRAGEATQAMASEKDAIAAERDTLATQVATLTTELGELRAAREADAAATATVATLNRERDDLTARLEQMEQRLTATQAEAARTAESLAALQRSTGETSTEAIGLRNLARQLQGANAVLAQENYQLKTMLSRTTGGPAPVATAPGTAPTPVSVAAPVPVPGARLHTVVAGDSLSRISQRYYGTAGRWQEIYNANSALLGPNGVLRVGTELRIP